MRPLYVLPVLLAVAACSDSPAAPPPAEAPMEAVSLEPLALATEDARTRLLPSWASAAPDASSDAVALALTDLEAALESRLASRILASAGSFGRALDGVPDDPASAADLDAFRLLIAAVEDAAGAPGTR